ncbi:unnamed protein product [marine sediment metagenome]|uniref:HTH luxR-type domain-containing protein n=1 Tax=marine sediment metagenome TaxID=412755 RepID=X1H2B7_9ZZZZ
MPIRKTLDEKSKSTKSNYIQNFSAREEEILRRKLAGATNKAIAEAMGLSENRVSFIVTSPIFQARQTSKQEIINKKFEEELATDPVKRKFKANREKAADKLIELIDAKSSQKLQREAAVDVLEFQGYTKKPSEDHSTKIYIDKSISKDIYIAVKALNIDENLLKELDVEGVVEEVESAGGDKSEDISSTGKKKLLGVLQGNTKK